LEVGKKGKGGRFEEGDKTTIRQENGGKQTEENRGERFMDKRTIGGS